jgi:hypothetical protein
VTSASFAAAVGAPRGRQDRVAEAYDGMSEDNARAFRVIIRDTNGYPHAQVAAALREIGYDIDRKQVQHYRERLALGKVSL